MIKAFVISYNRLTLLKEICKEIAIRGAEPIIVDNNSDYEPLKEWLAVCPYETVILPENIGHRCIWGSGVIEKYANGERFIITDPDLDISGVPFDMLEVLDKGLNKYRQYDKCGLSLRIDDLPKHAKLNDVRRIEGKYWKKPLDSMYFKAETDTTLALYQKHIRDYTLSGIRTNKPYTAIHVPWYYDKLEDLPEDERYYFTTANNSSSGKHRIE